MRKPSPARRALDQFVRGYTRAALWLSTYEGDEGGDSPMDGAYTASDIAPSSIRSIRQDCAKFLRQNRRDLAAYCADVVRRDTSSSSMEYAGHDLWLTRNGHGSGFWDRDGVGEAGVPEGPPGLGRRLTDAADALGSSDLYVGDDGSLYVSPENNR